MSSEEWPHGSLGNEPEHSRAVHGTVLPRMAMRPPAVSTWTALSMKWHEKMVAR